MTLTRRSVLATGLALAATPGLTHSTLRRSSPAAGAVVRGDVTEIRLVFSQAVEAALSALTLALDGKLVFEARKPEAADATTLLLRLGAPLAPGRYTLDWRALSVDTHDVRGRFSFEVKR